MEVTTYYCPSCHYGGSVSHPKDEYPGVIARRIWSDHKENVPDCGGDPREIQWAGTVPEETR